MSKGTGRPIKSYSAAQLEKMGCGHNVTVRKKYFSEYPQGRLRADQFVMLSVNNKQTRHIPFRLLTKEDQAKVTAYEADQKQAAALAKIRKQHQEELQALAELPLDDMEDRDFLWNEFAKKSNKQRDKATERLKAVMMFHELRDGQGENERNAIQAVADEYGQYPNTIRNWVKRSKAVNRTDRCTVLVNQHKGCLILADFTPEAWTSFKKDWLRREHPSISSCYRRLEAAAKVNGWTIPTKKTVENWIKRELDPMVIKNRREGMEAVERCFPAQKRNVEMFDVLEAVNGDGFVLDIWADFGNAVIAKPVVWSWQDIRSSKILAWRIDVSENSELLRLAILDLITDWGIPKYFWLDNTRAATSKQISGGQPNRYRFKVKDDDPLGVIPIIGSEVKYTIPAHGQSKPVERVHGIGGYSDFPSLPVFTGRGTKNKPIPIAELEEVFRSFVNEINARSDRQGAAVKGKSFDQVFNELYPEAIITRATEKQRKYCMSVAEVVTVSKTDASITLKAGKASFGENRYWHESLSSYMGQKVTVRFDPANMHGGVYVENLNGEQICFAETTHMGGFKDAEAAKEVARARGHFKKSVKAKAEAEERLTAAEARAQTTETPEPEKPQSKVTRMLTGINAGHESAPKKVANGDLNGPTEEMQKNFEMMSRKLMEERKNAI